MKRLKEFKMSIIMASLIVLNIVWFLCNVYVRCGGYNDPMYTLIFVVLTFVYSQVFVKYFIDERANYVANKVLNKIYGEGVKL